MKVATRIGWIILIIPLLVLSAAAAFLVLSSPKFYSAPTLSPLFSGSSPSPAAVNTYSPASPTLQETQAASTFTPTARKSPTPSSTATRTVPSLTPLPTLEPEHIIIISGHGQYFSIDCEASAAVDWAAFYGVTINEYEFQFKIPVSDNPEFGFVGGVNGPWGQVPPYSYGVYAGPVADVLNSYGVPAIALKNGDLGFIKNQIAADNPVIAWVIGNMETSPRSVYTDKQGRQVVVAPYEHVVILTGYNDLTQRIRYLNNGRFYEVPYTVFMASWDVLEKMAVIRGR